ncbi:hypothetical protein HNR46_004167 [Haloferula luteola]|uniref:Uncharacterized protein n=1 Tax=Haloferula luteola TaxID=595692 RepID=A0A840V7F1_9BACT|nr:hypothetical protein [Haloferula luteola]MBB5353902.1 hypothetical protein [Haloferula luteola]
MNSVEDAFKSLADLGCEIEAAEKVHRKKFLAEETEEYNSSRCLVDGLISSIYLKTNEPISNVSPESEYQLLVGASFIRTHLLLHNLILNGQIIDSHCLLRKQLEQLARLQELEEKTITELGTKKTPNVSKAGDGTLGRIYGAQSQVAHFSDPEVGSSLLNVVPNTDHARVTALPVYTMNSVYAMNSRLFLAIQFSSWFISKLIRWYPKKNFDLLQEQFVIAAETCVAAGIINKNPAKG